MTSDWIDISVPLYNGMPHWPGDPSVEIGRFSSIAEGGVANTSRMSCCVHVGTHMDAPLHFVPNGKSIADMPFSATMGPARVIAIEDERQIRAAELERHGIERGERLLFRTRNSERCWSATEFVRDFVSISADAACFLAARAPACVGVDYLSVGAFEGDGVETHQALLGAGIFLIEGLNLAQVEPGNYELICLPLRILDGDGAPARAIVRRLG